MFQESTRHETALRASQQADLESAQGGSQERRSINRWEFRTEQKRLRQQHVQKELVISLLVSTVVAVTFWTIIPGMLPLYWLLAVAGISGARVLLVYGSSGNPADTETETGDHQHAMSSLLAGLVWGGVGFGASLYGSFTHELFALAVITGISLTAFATMLLSPREMAAFNIAAMLPFAGILVWQGGQLQYAVAVLLTIFCVVTITSSRAMRRLVDKSFRMSSHNTELIKKLVTTRESAEKAKKYAEHVNAEMHEQIKERERAEERIRASEQRMSSILESMQDTIYQTDDEGRILWITPSIKYLLGYEIHEVLDRNITDFYVSPGDYTELKRALGLNGGRLQHFETRLRHKDGSEVWISENSHYRHDNGNEVSGIEGTIRDITALNHAREELQQEKERAQVTLGSIGDGVITTDLDGNIEYMNTVAEQATGWKLQDARHKPIQRVMKIIDERSMDAPPSPSSLCLENGKSITLAGHLLLVHRFRNQRLSIEVNASPIRDAKSDITGVVLVFHDVTELRGLAKKMSYQATHDSLTGLLNRREFENRIKQAVELAEKSGRQYALCYLDLDNFKVVNDTSGHIAGDELLKQLTIKLRMELRETDTFARLGGDEFGILLDGYTIANAGHVAEAIRKIVEGFRFVWDNTFFRIGVSIGLVPITGSSGTLTDILSAADSACYIAKEQGRNRIHRYEPDDEAVAERHGQMQWVQRIQNVLEENRFRLFFQPLQKLSMAAGDPDKIHGEVLLRMLDEDNRIVGPGSFIPSAERYSLMPAIDRWVITNTFRILRLDIDRINRTVSACCINLSGQSLSDDRFLDFLVNEIRESGVRPELLCFEITETAVIANLSNATNFILTLREMGCRFALDDFGVGLSSFSYLKNLAVDYLKLDGCFVKNMTSDNIDHAMVKAINQIGHTMNIRTIAEFVEDEATLEAVREIGIDYAQGYVVCKPMPIEIGLYGRDRPHRISRQDYDPAPLLASGAD